MREHPSWSLVLGAAVALVVAAFAPATAAGADAAGDDLLRELYRAGRLEECVERATDASRSDPAAVRPHYVKGLALLRLGRLAEAESALRQAQARAEGPRVLAALADVHYATGRFDLAAQEYLQAGHRATSRPARRTRLAACLAEVGHTKGALELLDESERPLDDSLLLPLVALRADERWSAVDQTSVARRTTPVLILDEPQAAPSPGRLVRVGAARIARLAAVALTEAEGKLWAVEPPPNLNIHGSLARYQSAVAVPSWAIASAGFECDVTLESLLAMEVDSARAVLVHEYAHALVAHRYRGVNTPGWLDEGLAQWADGRSTVDGARLQLASACAPGGAGLLSLRDLERCFSLFQDVRVASIAYAQAVVVHAELVARAGLEGPRAVLDALAAGRTPEQALRQVTGAGYEEFEAALWPGATTLTVADGGSASAEGLSGTR